jgi:1-deoxy-D-xylulose-5-phosphate synthase
VLTDWRCPLEEIPVGTGRKLRDGKDVAVLSIGPIGNDVERAINDLEQDKDPLAARASLGKVAHYDMRFLKPLDEQLLKEIAEKFSKIITIEDGVKAGGFGSAVLEWMNDHGFHPDILRMGIPDEFVEHGTVEQLHQIVGIDTESIKQNIAALL